ncbi:S-methyl-5-thioribose kinase [Neomoorella thermoacetica]|uniref:S-methyl-5-thioribose kinase n=1 Tax=Neomoorella thermoacetica TaxID=1525 RepID=UPI00069FEAFD|nr:S-methyl-5-thioribose kinase [Moorella thermoacetica]AKX96093.1 methylthioribose kinase [Moorella thermoacetica]OIQ55305.1 methylthioribose kinase [Moorella thermoacetica]OIQ55552.1 methylthioribose kinase [Moorella thermoacetica]OIQ60476.1 methylthioribose kinase [Moorella thermoacetica]QCZ99903.1 Methylthioribose kinase [Moorella thermoacetica]
MDNFTEHIKVPEPDLSRYQPLNLETVITYVKQRPELQELFSPDEELVSSEVGDGNLNLVFRIQAKNDPARSIIIKQALPYVRLVGDSWPLSPDRAIIEGKALAIFSAICPDLTPKLYYTDYDMYLNIMEDLAPRIILRKGLIKRQHYPNFTKHIGRYLARTLGETCDLYLDPQLKKWNAAQFTNPQLCKITEDLVFTNPYIKDGNGNHFNPLIAKEVEVIQNDEELHAEMAELKDAFMSHGQALIHGDLHTGSIMVDAATTKVMDPEFAFYGPAGFDIGAVIGNLFLNYASHEGHTLDPGERREYQQYLLDLAKGVWENFVAEFQFVWEKQDPVQRPDAYRERYMLKLIQDTAGFGGAKMMRRIIGLAHVEDLESIADPEKRAVAERLGLAIGRRLVKERSHFSSISDIINVVLTSRPEVF